jgi:hypothetical protein
VCPCGTYGDEGKAASRRHTLAALLFVTLAQGSRQFADSEVIKIKFAISTTANA